MPKTNIVEEWKDIPNYYGYQISNYGRVKSLGNKSNHKGAILLRQSNVTGYKCVNLYQNNKGTMVKVHRLVAQSFLLNPDNLPEVNHIDGDKTNNMVVNLEWCTSKENVNHARKIGLISPNKKGADDPRSIGVLQIDPMTEEVVGKFGSLREAERETGFARANISKVLNKEGRLSHGWKWQSY